MSNTTNQPASPATEPQQPRPSTKHWTKRWWFRALVVCLILLTYTGWQMWDINRFGYSDDGSSADCAIVLGAAAYNNNPSPVFKERINHAILLLKQNRIKSIILTGGYGDKAEYSESEVARTYCLENGVLPHQIHIEKTSQTTKENIQEANSIMEQQSFKTALIVSDPWHLKRACNIAEHYNITAKPSATTTTLFTSKETKTKFIWKEFLYLHLWKFN